jgi:hypothetical protein
MPDSYDHTSWERRFWPAFNHCGTGFGLRFFEPEEVDVAADVAGDNQLKGIRKMRSNTPDYREQ